MAKTILCRACSEHKRLSSNVCPKFTSLSTENLSALLSCAINRSTHVKQLCHISLLTLVEECTNTKVSAEIPILQSIMEEFL